LWLQVVVFQFWQFRRYWQFWQCLTSLCLFSQPSTPTPARHFLVFVANKDVFPNRRLGLPWATLGRPLRDPWVTQGSPSPRPNPKFGRGLQNPQKHKTQRFPVAAIFRIALVQHSVRLIYRTDELSVGHIIANRLRSQKMVVGSEIPAKTACIAWL
jgi:hypothetical protein